MLRDEAAGNLVGNVALAARHLAYALLIGLRNLAGPVVEDEGDRGYGKPHLAGDVLERDLGHAQPPAPSGRLARTALSGRPSRLIR